MATLLIQLPGAPSVAHVLKDETITIGRMKGNTIVIEAASVSLMHARITRRNGEFFLKDLNSTNGTTVNGQIITEARLQDRDQVRFAEIASRFEAEEATSAAQETVVASLEQAAKPAPASSTAAPETPNPRQKAPIPNQIPPKSILNLPPAVSTLLPYFGAVAALIVLGIVGWQATHLGSPARAKTRTPAIQGAPASPGLAQLDGRASADGPSPARKADSLPQISTSQQTESIPVLIARLKDDRAAERRKAVTELHGLGATAKEAAPALREALQDPDAEVRIWAALALVNMKSFDKPTIPILIDVLHDNNPMLRQVACLSLGIFPYEQSEKDSVVPALAETAGKDVDEDVRKAAVSALSVLAPELLGKTAKN
jgi:predicted component of type VI protein secretion system